MTTKNVTTTVSESSKSCRRWTKSLSRMLFRCICSWLMSSILLKIFPGIQLTTSLCPLFCFRLSLTLTFMMIVPFRKGQTMILHSFTITTRLYAMSSDIALQNEDDDVMNMTSPLPEPRSFRIWGLTAYVCIEASRIALQREPDFKTSPRIRRHEVSSTPSYSSAAVVQKATTERVLSPTAPLPVTQESPSKLWFTYTVHCNLIANSSSNSSISKTLKLSDSFVRVVLLESQIFCH